ncbi:hypothetical protein [Polymorphospora rubra]|uniref:Uncharacterized protein n=1 Tax=Polymorphospora rubra TaxID=338584 RepID=A0A810MWL3_9ACTN|nr:hypothetical protein [Polymorphospora rubra]BCJ64369.1 hypothetical protein Prubr_13900 [Polymorphospora rubra]
MRHILSLLAGAVAAPLAWVLVALGQGASSRTVSAWFETDRFDGADLVQPAVYLGAGGIVLGLVATLRISPLGPLLAGLLLLIPYAALFVDPFAVRDAVPAGWRLFGDPVDLRQPLQNGTLLFLGGLLVMATFSAKRWRRWPQPVLLPPPANYPPQPAYGARSQDEPTLDWPTGPPDTDSRPPTLGYPYDPPPPPPAHHPGPP